MAKEVTTYCNICGRKFNQWDKQESFGVFKSRCGYGTELDGCELELDICCDCMEDLVRRCKISPVKEGMPELGF